MSTLYPYVYLCILFSIVLWAFLGKIRFRAKHEDRFFLILLALYFITVIFAGGGFFYKLKIVIFRDLLIAVLVIFLSRYCIRNFKTFSILAVCLLLAVILFYFKILKQTFVFEKSKPAAQTQENRKEAKKEDGAKSHEEKKQLKTVKSTETYESKKYRIEKTRRELKIYDRKDNREVFSYSVDSEPPVYFYTYERPDYGEKGDLVTFHIERYSVSDDEKYLFIKIVGIDNRLCYTFEIETGIKNKAPCK